MLTLMNENYGCAGRTYFLDLNDVLNYIMRNCGKVEHLLLLRNGNSNVQKHWQVTDRKSGMNLNITELHDESGVKLIADGGKLLSSLNFKS